MAAVLMPGAPVAEAVLDDVRARLEKLGRPVGLATLLVGDDPASAGYIAKKHQACEAVGMRSFDVRLPAETTQAELHAEIDRLNVDPDVDAFIVQLPLPAHLDETAALLRVDADKDADGIHPVNLGRLVMGAPGARPATPLGIQAMLRFYEVPVEGRHVVVVGRGVTIGRPIALLLSLKEPGANAAVTVVHTGVKDWAEHTRRADIVVAGAGSPSIIRPEHVRPGAAVVSAGIVWEGKVLRPDVDESVQEVAGWVTPRLGGVGPTTVAMLLSNAVSVAERRS
jgi:methylenetetrahydrofolate dehydrogenase (NADP+)/methenyltetrahydrofolate cyclohydrolase